MDTRPGADDPVPVQFAFLLEFPGGIVLAFCSGRERVMTEYNRFATPMTPGSLWPDGSPVSNWSQAVATLARHGSVRFLGAQTVSAHEDSDWQPDSERVPSLVRA